MPHPPSTSNPRPTPSRLGLGVFGACRSRGLLVVLLLLLAAEGTAFAQDHIGYWYYSAVDSTFYAQYAGLLPYDSCVTYRLAAPDFRPVRTAMHAPGKILTSEPVPGVIYATSVRLEGGWGLVRSTDGGDSWQGVTVPFEISPDGLLGHAGFNPGESFLLGDWLHFTHDSWVSVDSLYCQVDSASIGPAGFGSVPGMLWGTQWHSAQQSPFCLSSDTGRTWTIGHAPPLPYSVYPRPGAGDENWLRLADNWVCMIRDTGAVLDSICHLILPPRWFDWYSGLGLTALPGEACYINEGMWADGMEILLYRIRDYGAAIDSFSFFLPYNDLSAPQHAPPRRYEFSAFPNPFNATTTLRFSLPYETDVTLKIYDMLGREVAVLVDAPQPPGEHAVRFDANDLPSGLYFARLTAAHSTQTQKLLLVK